MEWKLGPADTWVRMEVFLRELLTRVSPLPRALLVVSAHWESDPIAITASADPALHYDYYGFPEHTYTLRYPVPGAPGLAAELAERLDAAGVPAVPEITRGLDHGVFVPGLLIRPEADIPVVQLSLHPSLDPALHLRLGAALAPLREQGVLIIGSGMSYHNLEMLMQQPLQNSAGDAFDAWLDETCTVPRQQRERRLIDWTTAPGARESHPREEHLLPLHVVAGAAREDRGARIYRDRVLGAPVAAFAFGG